MTLRCNACTACGIYTNRNFRKRSLDQKCIGNHTDICTKSYQGNASNFFILINRNQLPCKICRTESFFINWLCFSQNIQFFPNLPAICPPDTMRNRKIFPLLCFQIICLMGISREEYFSVKISDLLLHLRNNGHSLLRAKCAVNKIILHVYYDENVLHVCHPIIFITYFCPTNL